jgi:hypothetical protein
LNLNANIQVRRRLITYNTINGITALRKHVNSNHCNILKRIEEEMNSPLREDEKQVSKKRPICLLVPYPFFCYKGNFQEDDL